MESIGAVTAAGLARQMAETPAEGRNFLFPLMTAVVAVRVALRKDRVAEALQRNPILVTALNPVIGYEKAAKIAKRAYAEQRPVFDVALEDSGQTEKDLRRLLDDAPVPVLLVKPPAPVDD